MHLIQFQFYNSQNLYRILFAFWKHYGLLVRCPGKNKYSRGWWWWRIHPYRCKTLLQTYIFRKEKTYLILNYPTVWSYIYCILLFSFYFVYYICYLDFIFLGHNRCFKSMYLDIDPRLLNSETNPPIAPYNYHVSLPYYGPYHTQTHHTTKSLTNELN